MRNASDFAIPVKLIAFSSSMISVFATKGSPLTPIVFFVALIYLLAQKNYRQSLSYIVFYGILWFLMFLIREYGLKMLVFSEFHLFLFWWMTPIFMVSVNLANSPPGQISSFLSKIHAPTTLILGILVVFRFFPTMKAEVRALRESMYNRGLATGKQFLFHPASTFEYILVPIMMRCIQIADQLTISALSRGIEAPVKRTSYYDKNMTAKDYLCIALCLLSLAAFICMGVSYSRT